MWLLTEATKFSLLWKTRKYLSYSEHYLWQVIFLFSKFWFDNVCKEITSHNIKTNLNVQMCDGSTGVGGLGIWLQVLSTVIWPSAKQRRERVCEGRGRSRGQALEGSSCSLDFPPRSAWPLAQQNRVAGPGLAWGTPPRPERRVCTCLQGGCRPGVFKMHHFIS